LRGVIRFISVLPKTNKEVRKGGNEESGVAVLGIDLTDLQPSLRDWETTGRRQPTIETVG